MQLKYGSVKNGVFIIIWNEFNQKIFHDIIDYTHTFWENNSFDNRKT